MKLIRLDIDSQLINREYFYKIKGDLDFLSYDSERKLAKFLYNNDEELRRYYTWETIKYSHIDVYNIDDFKELKYETD